VAAFRSGEKLAAVHSPGQNRQCRQYGYIVPTVHSYIVHGITSSSRWSVQYREIQPVQGPPVNLEPLPRLRTVCGCFPGQDLRVSGSRTIQRGARGTVILRTGDSRPVQYRTRVFIVFCHQYRDNIVYMVLQNSPAQFRKHGNIVITETEQDQSVRDSQIKCAEGAAGPSPAAGI
jgi:hypothetical protein